MPDVSVDPRYIKVVEDVRSELVIPLLLKDRCIGVFDLESPELDAFTKSDVEILTLLASQAAVAIENARLYETIRANELRIEKELRFAQRVQAALLPTELPKRLKGVDVAARFAPARELGGDLYDFPRAGAEQPRRRRRRRVGQRRARGALQRVRRRAGPLADVPAALHARAVQSRRRARVDEHDPARAAARGVLLHAVLRRVRLQAPHGDPGEFRPAVSDSLLGGGGDACCGTSRRSSCRACRWDRSPARPTTKSRSTWRRVTSTCSAATESLKPTMRPARNSGRPGCWTW